MDERRQLSCLVDENGFLGLVPSFMHLRPRKFKRKYCTSVCQKLWQGLRNEYDFDYCGSFPISQARKIPGKWKATSGVGIYVILAYGIL